MRIWCFSSWARGRWASLRQQDEVLSGLKTQPPGGRLLLYRQMEALPISADGEDVLAALEAGLADGDPLARSQALASRGVFLPRLARNLEPRPGQGVPEPDPAFPARATAFVAPIVSGLAKAMDAKDARRLRALVAIGLYPSDEALAKLEAESKKPEHGILVAEALARQGGPAAGRILTETILHVPSSFRAAQVAQLRFVPSTQGVELIRRAIRKGDGAMLVAGAIALEGITGPEVATLAREAAERCADGWAALQALESLRRLGQVEHGPLVIHLIETAKIPLVKAVGLRVLGYLNSPEVVSYLLESFRTLAEPLRPFALESLVLTGAPEHDVRPLLDGLVSSPKLSLALPAVKAMLAFDPDLAVGLISQILARPEPVARFIGAQCLAFVRTEASREQLTVMAREDPSVPVRVAALVSLAELPDVPGSAESAAEALTDARPEVRRAAARALSRLPAGATIAPELNQMLEAGLAAEPDGASLWAWGRALAAHSGPDVIADRVRAFAKTEPIRAAMLLRAADPDSTTLAKVRAQLARECDAPALKAEVALSLICSGEAWGVEELGRLIGSGTERESVEACAAAERLGMMLPAAAGLHRMSGLLARVADREDPQLELAEGATTTSRLKLVGGEQRGLDEVLVQRAREGSKSKVAGPRPTLALPGSAPKGGGDADVAELSVYSSQGVQARPKPLSWRIGDQMRAARDQLGWLGILWVGGLLLLFGHIVMQVAGFGFTFKWPSSAPKASVSVEKKSGVASFEKAGATADLKGGAELAAQGEVVTTGAGSRVTLKAGLETRITLGERAKVKLAKGSKENALDVSQIAGSILVDARGADPVLELRIGAATISVSEGKALLVNDTLYVGRGRIQVKHGPDTVTVPSGERIAVDAQGQPGTAMAFSMAGFDWEPN